MKLSPRNNRGVTVVNEGVIAWEGSSCRCAPTTASEPMVQADAILCVLTIYVRPTTIRVAIGHNGRRAETDTQTQMLTRRRLVVDLSQPGWYTSLNWINIINCSGGYRRHAILLERKRISVTVRWFPVRGEFSAIFNIVLNNIKHEE